MAWRWASQSLTSALSRGPWPPVWLFFLAPATRLVQTASGGVGPWLVVRSFWAEQELGAGQPPPSHPSGVCYPLLCQG